MHHMKQVGVRDLRYNFPAVERMLRRGETIELTKRKKVVCRLVPVAPSEQPPMPDFMGRLKKIYGGRKLKISMAQRIAEERDRY
jgi:antitoxin (DNA-binding transcriptional repressor) of toxin-antitoxin stability system